MVEDSMVEDDFRREGPVHYSVCTKGTVLGCGEQLCVGVNKLGYVSSCGLSVDLLNGVPQSNHVTARRFRGTAGSVLGEFCVVHA
jgi:hypothetical protein